MSALPVPGVQLIGVTSLQPFIAVANIWSTFHFKCNYHRHRVIISAIIIITSIMFIATASIWSANNMFKPLPKISWILVAADNLETMT